MTGSIFISPEVDPARISPDAVIHPGCRISGEKTSLGPGCVLGAEAPATLENCRLGRGVKLKGGYFSGSVFLDGANLGSGAHVREGTLLEEQSGGAHSVGLKQTVLLPFVTLGSLINFCDILMAGGTGRKAHSEVGSSYIHFNFTPHQDKATASLIGDVPRGVLLGQKPVFLGGQGGLVGPARIAYGSVIAAGGICRRDLLEENQLHIPAAPGSLTVSYDQGVYKSIDRIVRNGLIYIGNIRALKAWYENVRVLFIRDRFDRAVFEGALENLDLILTERINRLEQLAGRMEYSFQTLEKTDGDSPQVGKKQREFSKGWKTMREQLETPLNTVADAGLMNEIGKAPRTDYITAVRNLSEGARRGAAAWLQSVVDEAAALWN
ncbi:MAG: bifunctional UDP-N-acetylglucosamine pyrophosphorylase / glucosamine-phosphate N-acetyltransferase [Verrucomicrobiota bacterium]|jgi:UDP-N-acetylglucosamine/UDP-N-acetylgalactosamine diphosphorylase|nr:bifunctional UDP-N-acetylglucosamine pyrophosphorylase / glucosamine-phosphate N-acetyltransferase [Verrucomicrobiota bacterium]MDK2963103.1 bifunctional UDP-N-acetylglucosamine pyrophosphorylase / glucosamine-phosphate N-acetyltransferase [Verrucomicrobiota bacterium]